MKCCRSTWNQQNNCSIHFRACLGMDFGFMLDLEYADFHKTLESDRPPKSDNHNKRLLRCKGFWRELIVHILETILRKNANVTQSRKNSEAMPRSNSFCCGWGGSPVSSCGDTQIIPGHKRHRFFAKERRQILCGRYFVIMISSWYHHDILTICLFAATDQTEWLESWRTWNRQCTSSVERLVWDSVLAERWVQDGTVSYRCVQCYNRAVVVALPTNPKQ